MYDFYVIGIYLSILASIYLLKRVLWRGRGSSAIYSIAAAILVFLLISSMEWMQLLATEIGMPLPSPKEAVRRVREVYQSLSQLQTSLAIATTSVSFFETSLLALSLGGLRAILLNPLTLLVLGYSPTILSCFGSVLEALNSVLVALVLLLKIMEMATWLAPLALTLGVSLLPVAGIRRVALVLVASGALLGVVLPVLIIKYLKPINMELKPPLPSSWGGVEVKVYDATLKPLKAPVLVLFNCSWRGLDGSWHSSEHSAWILNGSSQLLLPQGSCRLEKVVVYWLRYDAGSSQLAVSWRKLGIGVRVVQVVLPHHYMTIGNWVRGVVTGRFLNSNDSLTPILEDGCLRYEVSSTGLIEVLSYSKPPRIVSRGANYSVLFFEKVDWWTRESGNWFQLASARHGVDWSYSRGYVLRPTATLPVPDIEGWRLVLNVTSLNNEALVVELPPAEKWGYFPDLAYTSIEASEFKPLPSKIVEAVNKYLKLVVLLPIVAVATAILVYPGEILVAFRSLIRPPQIGAWRLSFKYRGRSRRPEHRSLRLACALLRRAKVDVARLARVRTVLRSIANSRSSTSLVFSLARRRAVTEVMEERLDRLLAAMGGESGADIKASIRRVLKGLSRGDPSSLYLLSSLVRSLEESINSSLATSTPREILEFLGRLPYSNRLGALSERVEALVRRAQLQANLLVDDLARASRLIPPELLKRYRELLLEFSEKSLKGEELSVLPEVLALLREAYRQRPTPQLREILEDLESSQVMPPYLTSEWLQAVRDIANELVKWAIPVAPERVVEEVPVLTVKRLDQLLADCVKMLEEVREVPPDMLEDVYNSLKIAAEIARLTLAKGGGGYLRAYTAISLAKELVGEVIEDQSSGRLSSSSAIVRHHHR